MSRTRRDFMKEAAVMGAAAAAGGTAVPVTPAAEDRNGDCENDRCPYFDQPMFCKGLTKSGKPLCEE